MARDRRRPQRFLLTSPAPWAVAGALALAALPASAWAVEVELKPGDNVAQLTASMQAVDVFTFSGGLYALDAGITWRGLGTETAPIVLRAKSGEVPVLQLSAGSTIISIEGSTYLEIEGLVFSGDDTWDVEDGGAYWHGVRVYDSSFVTFEGCEIRNIPRYALVVTGSEGGGGHGIVVRRCHIHDVLYDDGMYFGCGNGSCAYTEGIVENNWVHDLLGSQADGIEIGPGSSGFEILDNVVYNSQDGGIATSTTNFGEANVVEGNAVWSVVNEGLYVGGGAIVRNNVIFNSQGYGLRSEPSDTASAGAVVISHNTIVRTGRAGIYLRNWSGAEGMVLANNAVTNVTGIALDISVDEAVHVVGNVVTGLVTGAAAGFTGGGGLDDYADAEEWDYWPSEGSHLVGTADTASESWVPPLDFNGMPRPGDDPDVGALERSGPTNPGWQIREGFKEPTEDIAGADPEDVTTGCGCSQPSSDPTPALALGLWAVALGRRRRRAGG